MLQTKLTQGLSQRLTGLFLIFLLAVSLTACGGSDGGSGSGTIPSGKVVTVVARAGPIDAVRIGETVNLDGSKSFTSSSQPLSYSWSFSHKPDLSTAHLQGETSVTPNFVADIRGVYMVQLVVRAEGVSSDRFVKMVVATVAPESFTGPFNHQGLSSNCVNCHTGDQDPIPGKSVTHIATSDSCQTCHTPQSFTSIPFVDHLEAFGNCSECHNNVVAIGKSPTHSQTDAECDECHNTTSFLELELDGSFDHSGISRACSGCHNGTVSIGKTATPADTPPGTHPVTEAECGYCHTTETFLNAYPDHTGPTVVGSRCDSCHGSSATGPTNGHPVVNVDCASCHSVVTFSMNGIFNHNLLDASIQSCESCHNDSNSINAPGKGSAVPAHPSTTSDCGACHNTDSFNPAFGIDHTGPAVLAARCDSCHVADGSGSASGMPASTADYAHMPTIEDCKVCHTPGTFNTGTYDHSGVTNNCESCHDNRISVGKLLNHLPTTQDCIVCHTVNDFAGATFDHVGIDTNNCTQCHNGDISLGKSSNHLPTALDCSSCHDINNFNTFAGITFNHLGIDNNNCNACHNTGVATGKIVNHIAAQGDCSVCHDSTTDFTSTTFLTSVHQGITRGCEGCHTDNILSSKPNLLKANDHLPTTQDCDVCHSVNGFTPSNFDHVDISGNCSSCHSGDFASINARGAPNTTIHTSTSEDCAVCHNTANFADAYVDHTGPEVVGNRCDSCHDGGAGGAIGKNVGHVPTTEDCNVCHVPGTFSTAVFNHTGIVDNCESCHNGTDATGKDAKTNPDHIPTTEDCSVCHIPTSFADARFDHQGIVANCDSCHNGNTARGKIPPPGHVPTNADCTDCHVTTGFVPATFDHAGIVDNCTSCHNGTFAEGKSITHVATNQDCGVCHNTNGFIPATFDHTGIVDNCSSCHGVTATGKDNDHIATGLDCHFCHTTATFADGTWVHDSSSAGNCDSCHNNSGGGATSKPSGHLATNVQCDSCHTTDGWAPTDFTHDPNGNYPGDHRRDPGCSGCHGSSVNATFVYPSPQYAPDCAACHAGDFRRKDKHIGGKNGTVSQNRNCAGSGCHRVSDKEWD